jgi:putative tryptophan/tyrosine transport system substrate-binding protein
MRRREFMAGIGGAVAWPLAAWAQPIPVIGFLSSGAMSEGTAAFRQGLGEAGYVEGRNVAIEYRFAEGQYDRLPAMAVDLVRRQVSIICAAPTNAARAAKAATSTIPIVFNVGADPVQAGLVAALNRPGGNLTGIARLIGQVGSKQMGLLHEATPKVDTMGYLANPNNPNAEFETRRMQMAAELLRLKLVVAGASRASDFEMAFETLVRQRAGAVVTMGDGYLASEANRIVQLAAHHAIPAIYPFPIYTAAGGLMSYGPDLLGTARQFGVYAGRVLKGSATR